MKKLILSVILAFTFVAQTSQAIEIPPGLTDQQTVEYLIPHFNEKTHRTLIARPVVWDGHSNLNPDMMGVRDHAQAEGWFAFTIPGIRDSHNVWHVDTVGPNAMLTCFIAMVNAGDHLTGRDRQTILAHELYHCYQYEKLGSFATDALPAWLKEGTANYVGESEVGGSRAMGDWWEPYLNSNVKFLNRTYDAFGLYFHMEAHGVDPWMIFEELYDLNGTAERKFAYLLTMLDAEVVTTWPMGIAKKADWGTDWDAQGKNIPATAHYPIDDYIIADSVQALNFDFSRINVLRFAIATNDPIRFKLQGVTGGIRVEDINGNELYSARLSDGVTLQLCTSSNCGCPNGDDALNMVNVKNAKKIIFIGAGIDMVSAGVLTVDKAEAHCCPGSLNLDQRLVGTWEMDIQPLVENMLILDQPGQTRRGSGEIIVKIDRNGSIHKSTALHMTKFTPESPGISASLYSYNATGSFNGCLETKPWPTDPTKFYLTITHVEDTTRTSWFTAFFDGGSGPHGFYPGEEALIAWGIGQPNQPNSDQSAYGKILGDDAIAIRWLRGPIVRKLERVH